MNKTLYLRKRDIPIWDEAQHLAKLVGLELSHVIVNGLKRFNASVAMCSGCQQPLVLLHKYCPNCGKGRDEITKEG